jgi:hypothetical protein
MLVILALLLSISRISAEQAKPYEEKDGWRMLQSALPFAIKGDHKAIHDCFMASYLRASSPFLGGEDCEAISSGLSEILFRMGDQKFSHALSVERPEVIGAVKFWIRTSPGFYSSGGEGFKNLRIDDYPRTKKLLDSVPDTDFPVKENSPRRAPLLKQLSQ